MKVKSESEVAQLCPTLSDPMDCSLPGSPVYGIFQARVLEWGAIAFSEYYSAIKKNEIISFAPTWVQLAGGGNGNTLQYSCLGNPIDRGAWWVIYSSWGHKRARYNWVTKHSCTGTTRDYLTKKRKSERKTNTIWYHLYVESKVWQKWTYLKNRNRLTDIENRLVVVKRVGGEERTGIWGLSDLKLFYIAGNKVLLHSTWNYI